MEIGTAEPIEEEPKRKLKKRPSARSGSGQNGGGGNNDGGGNGGGDRPRRDDLNYPEMETSEKSGILMYFLLLVVLMTFGGLIGAYVVLSTNSALEWKPFSLPVQVWISTMLILASSVTYHFGKSALTIDNFSGAKKWFVGTTALGAAFISSQILAWMELVNRGILIKGNPYAGFFYILTAVHAIHVIGGILALGYVLLRSWNAKSGSRFGKKRNAEAKSIGWYWHTMGGLWLILLFLLGFWK